jgi:hypothetical protein
MAFYQCGICLTDGSPVAERVTVSIEETDRDGGRSWYGTVTAGHLTNLSAGKTYRITLDDGRTGEFVVRRNTFAGGENRAVSIHGTGRLA